MQNNRMASHQNVPLNMRVLLGLQVSIAFRTRATKSHGKNHGHLHVAASTKSIAEQLTGSNAPGLAHHSKGILPKFDLLLVAFVWEPLQKEVLEVLGSMASVSYNPNALLLRLYLPPRC